MDKITRVGIDLSKRVLHVTALDASGCQGYEAISAFRHDLLPYSLADQSNIILSIPARETGQARSLISWIALIPMQ